MPRKSHRKSKKKQKKLEDALQEFQISEPAEDLAKEIELDDVLDQDLLFKWPRPRMKVPEIFLHKSVDFAQHVEKLLLLKINFYQPYLGTNFTRISCLSFNDHKAMLQYFETNNLPFHTFGHPTKRQLKVIIRGLPKDIDLQKFLKALKCVGIPVTRIHKMHMKEFAKDKAILVLVVVPYSDEGKKLLKLKKAFGQEVKLEPPLLKTQQCHRCQKWGHVQRYCHGDVKCVKCAGDHFSDKCTRDREKESPTCANCGGNHTASYRECFYCPDSTEYKQNRKSKMVFSTVFVPQTNRVVVTTDNYQTLYKKVKNIPKHSEAVPF